MAGRFHERTLDRIRDFMIGATVVVLTLAALGAGADLRDRKDRFRKAASLTGGDPTNGPRLMRDYGCVGCHTIPGIPQANATVGPPLTKMAMRTYIAGVIENNPDNMLRWLMNPPAVDEKTAMPNVHLTEPDARDIAAYIYTLE